MSRSRARSIRLARYVSGAAFVIASACSGDGPSGPVPANEVRVSNNQFTPANRTVSTGTTVTFRWAAGSAAHNVTFGDGPASADQSSGTYERLFAVAGAYPYRCTIHAGMTGAITVQ